MIAFVHYAGLLAMSVVSVTDRDMEFDIKSLNIRAKVRGIVKELIPAAQLFELELLY